MRDPSGHIVHYDPGEPVGFDDDVTDALEDLTDEERVYMVETGQLPGSMASAEELGLVPDVQQWQEVNTGEMVVQVPKAEYDALREQAKRDITLITDLNLRLGQIEADLAGMTQDRDHYRDLARKGADLLSAIEAEKRALRADLARVTEQMQRAERAYVEGFETVERNAYARGLEDGRTENERQAEEIAVRDRNSLEALLTEVQQWQRETFTEATWFSKGCHLVEEAQEARDSDNDALELADCLILIAGMAGLAGIDLKEAVTRKMAINRTRHWGVPDVNGVVRHDKSARLDAAPAEARE